MPASISWRCCHRSPRPFWPRRRMRPASARPPTTPGATFLYEYPAVQSPLARPKAADPRLAERFELYACGVELANGFGELVDVVEQRRRLEHQMAEKERIYGERYPIDEDFLRALAA